MITHYLKVAVRNLLKYKTQTIISILGLAVGFVCFALSAFWIRYEMTYDAFHEDADRIYLVITDDELSPGKYACYTPPALTDYLQTNYQEMEKVFSYRDSPIFIMHNNQQKQIDVLGIDSTFLNIMNIKILEGSNNFLIPSDDNMETAITRSGAMELFGTTDVIGKTLYDAMYKQELRIGAIVSEWGEHSTMKYKLLRNKQNITGWTNSSFKTLIKVKPSTDINALEEKMNLHFPKELQSNEYFPNTGLTRFFIKPITGIRHDKELMTRLTPIISLRYISYFSIIGLLIIATALFNYLSLFMDRYRTRLRELALRKVNGASEFSLMLLLISESIITLFLSICLGMAFIELSFPVFCDFVEISKEGVSIYKDCLAYIIVVAFLVIILTVLTILFFRKKTLQNSIQGIRSERMFRKTNIVLQLFVSLFFICCTTVIQKQLHYLRNTDIGFEYENRGAMSIWLGVDMNVWEEKIKALPMITETVSPKYWPLVGMGNSSSYLIDSWEGLDKTLEKPLTVFNIMADKEFFDFYSMQLLAGEWVNAKTKVFHANIMESTARKMGWTPEEAIGKQMYHTNKKVTPITITGVLKDCAFTSPSNDIPDVVFTNTLYSKYNWERCFVLFKFQPGTWEKCRQMIEEMQQNELPDRKLFLYNEEEVFNSYLKSEDTLSRLLNLASLVCILISIFGIYSLITLTCEQRRKEIAIRKVNGAKISNILQMFFKEYMLLLTIASLVAFPASYAVMKQWLETYNRQTEIGAWVFITIFIGFALVIIGSIGYRVWKAANENPADVVKSE